MRFRRLRARRSSGGCGTCCRAPIATRACQRRAAATFSTSCATRSPICPVISGETREVTNVRDILTSATVARLVAGASAVTAPGQQGTVRPGDIPRPDVYVMNHGASEAIPVDLRESNVGRPLDVRVANGDGDSSTLRVR